MIPRRFGIVLLVFSLWCVAAHAVDVRVRIVYLKHGKPANGQEIRLTLGDPQRASPTLPGITDSDGIATFHFAEGVTDSLWVDYDNGRIVGCAWSPIIPLEDMMKLGVTIGRDQRYGGRCKGSDDTIKRLQAKPGEIVIFVRKVTIWDDLRWY